MFNHIQKIHHPLRHAAGACSIVAGLLHATIVSAVHFTPFPPLETAFFVGIGILQIAIGFFFFFKPHISIYRLGLLINGGVAMLYVFMRFLPVPFMDGSEGFDLLGIFVLITEAIAVKSSIAWLLTHNKYGKNTNFFFATSSATVIIFVGAVGFYSSSMGMEKVFPDRNVAHGHGHAASEELHEPQKHIENDNHHKMQEEEHIEDIKNHNHTEDHH
jgi:hypothetical protein